ncbi:uncharacterized protein LOC134247973 isoform X2 [Saccostrea cucullata]|uniref:uncharacterized protein LOC134247973 isoform X2 n=1 Tax=Saccostrea cuccullata TaxID=36930 RepID=UPI002ED352D9
MGNEHSTPERTEKCPVFESPVILPLPEKELDDGGVYKGDQPNDRILKVSEILRKSLEMDIEENGVTSNDSMTENGCDVTPQSPTFRSSITIHLTPCVEYLQSPDTESTSNENTDIKTDQAFHNEDRQTGESDQVLEQNIDKTISNCCMSRRENTLCNGYTSDMKGHIHAGVAQEGEDEEVVRVEKVKYHRGNSNIDEYIEKAKNLAVKTNGLSADVSDSGDKGAQNGDPLKGSDKIDQELMEVKKNAEVLSVEPSQENCENHASVPDEINLELKQENEKHAVIADETMASAQVQENGGNYSPVVSETINSDLEHGNSEKQIITVGETRPSEPARENEEEPFAVLEEIIPSTAASVHAEEHVENAEANLPVEHTNGQEDNVDDLEIKVLSEVIKKDEIQRQTSAEEQREKSKKKHHSPLSKFGVKFNEAWKSIKPKRRESMEKSKTRVAGAYAAEQDFTVNHASPTKEKSAFEWEEPNRTKVNIIQTNGISFEGATQKAYAICNEYAYVVRKQSYSNKIDVPSEFAEDKDIDSDAISDIDEELVAKSTREDELSDFEDSINAEKQGPVYVGLIVKDANEGEENPADLEEGLSENGEESITASFNIDTQHEKTNNGLNSDDKNETAEHELEGCVESTHTDILHEQPIANESTGTQSEKMEIEKPTESTQKSTSPTKVKKKNSILKYLLHSPKKSKTKKKESQLSKAQEVTITVDSKTEAVETPSEGQHTRNTCADNIDPLLTYVECREKDLECAKESDKTVESKEENSSTNSSAAEFDEVDLNSTSDTHSNLNVKIEDLKDSLPNEEIIPSVSQEDVEIQDNATEEIAEKENASLTLTSDKTELKTTQNSDIEKAHLNNADNFDAAENDSKLIEKVDDVESVNKNLPQNIEIEEKSDKPPSNEKPVQEIKGEPNLEEEEFNENQAVVIDVTCSDDNDIIVDGTDHDLDVIQRQEKRKLPDEENDSPELQNPSGSHSESVTTASQSAKSSPTRKKKKKRTNSLSAKISDFFGVGEFRRRISTHSNKSDKSPHEEKNIWSPNEKQTERKQSGSSLHEEVDNSIPETEATCPEIQEEIIPERSLEAKSMPTLNIEHSEEGGEKTKAEATHVKMRGRGKEKRPKRNSFLESLGLHTSKSKKRPVISSPIRQHYRKSLFDDEIHIDVDQDLHIISLSDDENDPNATPKKSKDSGEITETATEVVEKHPDEDRVEETPTVNVDEVEKPEKDSEENNAETNNKDTNSEEKTHKDDLNLPISKEEGSDESKQEMKISMVERKLSPGEYVSLEQAPESKAETESVTDYLKFEQEDSELSPEIEGKELTLQLNGEKRGDDNESCDLNLESSTENSELENFHSSKIEAEIYKEIKTLDTEDNLKKDSDVTDILEGESGTESTVTNNETKNTDERSSMNANTEEEVHVSKVESPESADNKEITDKEVEDISSLNEGAKTVAENENSANISNDVHSEDSQTSHHITVKATIETPPVSNEIDLCEVMKDRVAECDALCNDAEYDSIKVEEERTVAIENPNYCATCPVENKSPSDTVDNLHSQVDGDVNGQDESLTLPNTEASAEERKYSTAAARSASMEELTVHSSHIYEEIEKKRPIIYRRFSDKTENRKVICTSPEPDGKKVKKKKSRSSSFSEFFRNPTKYKMPAWRHKKTKEIV